MDNSWPWYDCDCYCDGTDALATTESQVEGCTADLSALRHYHKRYKVCQDHLKMDHLMHEGVVQRFCQQCSRFHQIAEFEGDRRSCKV